MIINDPQATRTKRGLLLSSRIITQSKEPNYPEHLWFLLRDCDSEPATLLADAFLILMVPIAMRLKEEIVVEGPVSSRLAHGIEAYQDIYSAWWPESFEKVDIHYKELLSRKGEQRPEGAACSFSGGVDSFYSLYQNSSPIESISDYQLTHALFINGFDQIEDFEGEGFSRRLYDIYAELLKGLDIELLMVASNLCFFTRKTFSKKYLQATFGTMLSACAHSYGHMIGRFALAGHATYRYEDLRPIGSHPMLDHHLGTDQLEMFHYGSKASRSERVEFLADKPEVQSSLRVCIRKPEFDKETGQIINCCRCIKCRRTMVSLELTGKLDAFQTFPLKHRIEDYKNPKTLQERKAAFILDNLHLAERRNRPDWIEALEGALALQKEKARSRSKASQ